MLRIFFTDLSDFEDFLTNSVFEKKFFFMIIKNYLAVLAHSWSIDTFIFDMVFENLRIELLIAIFADFILVDILVMLLQLCFFNKLIAIGAFHEIFKTICFVTGNAHRWK